MSTNKERLQKELERWLILCAIVFMLGLFGGQKWGRAQGIEIGARTGWERHSEVLGLYCEGKISELQPAGMKPTFKVESLGDRRFKCVEVKGKK